MGQYIILKDGTKLHTESIISLGARPNEVIEINFNAEESFQKLFAIYSKNSETFKQENIEEFSIYTTSQKDMEDVATEDTLQGTHYGFCNLISITFNEENCTVKLEKLSEYDMTISDIKKSIELEAGNTNARVLEIESILFDLMSVQG